MTKRPPKAARKVVPRVRKLSAGQGTCLECGSPAGEWIADGTYVCERCLSKWAEEAGVKYLRGTGRSADVKIFRKLYREAREAGEA